MCNKYFYTKMNIILTLVFSNIILAQEKAFTDNFFDSYTKIGLSVGTSILFTENENNAVDFEYLNINTFEIGLSYNFLNKNNFIFSTNALLRSHNNENNEKFKKEDIDKNYDFSRRIAVGTYNEYKLSLIADYFFKINKDIFGFGGLGPEVGFASNVYSMGASFVIDNENRIERGYTEKGDYNKNIFLGANIRLGLTFLTKPILIQPYLEYHYQPNVMYTNLVKTQNLKISQNTVSQHSYTGNYLMFGLKIIPSRSLFRNKKIKD